MSPKGLLQLSLVIPVAVRKHAFLNTILCSLSEWSGSRSWYSSKDSTLLVPNCPLKAYNVHGYQSVP